MANAMSDINSLNDTNSVKIISNIITNTDSAVTNAKNDIKSLVHSTQTILSNLIN